jgi:hypothetical protein
MSKPEKIMIDVDELKKHIITEIELKEALDRLAIDEDDAQGWDIVIRYVTIQMVLNEGTNPICPEELTERMMAIYVDSIISNLIKSGLVEADISQKPTKYTLTEEGKEFSEYIKLEELFNEDNQNGRPSE